MQSSMEVKHYNERTDDEKEKMWDEIAYQLSKPKSDRPQHKEMYELYGIPESTYYWTTSKAQFKQKIVENCLNEAKEWMPELLEVLKEKALYDRSEKSIEMALKYIANVAEKFDHTSNGKTIRQDSKLDELTDSLKDKNKQQYVNPTGKGIHQE